MRITFVLIILSWYVWACSAPESKRQTISGVEIYKTRCVTCHGTDGRMGMNGAKELPDSPLNAAQRIEVVTHGRNIMPGFKEMLSEEEIKAVVEFTMTLK
ncbi:cytochrome c [Aureispira sp. CCB-QB1]|uniref:c-type cytochrome n=1 Tax=Aureispira sp. CCB-QB1 TaxID=1313421 RepID=UPI00069650A5|nr:cytochrome c [Aureispira sp. CCB-QB1]